MRFVEFVEENYMVVLVVLSLYWGLLVVVEWEWWFFFDGDDCLLGWKGEWCGGVGWGV